MALVGWKLTSPREVVFAMASLLDKGAECFYFNINRFGAFRV